MTSNTKQTLLHQLNDHSATVTVYSLLAQYDVAVICVPTPDPDVHCEALQTRRMWKRGQYLTEGASYGTISVREI